MKKNGVQNRSASSPLRVNMPRVVLLVETSREVGRSILRGVERYARINGPWSLHLAPGDLAQLFPNVSTWGATGIIARIETPEVEKAILKSGLPFVALDLYEPQKSKRGKFKNASEVFVNSPLVGKMAAEHLLERNLSQYAFVGEINDVLWSTDREKAFTDTIVQAGYKVFRYTPPKTSDRTGDDALQLGQWLYSLPKPIGVMAANDVRGRQVIAACQDFNVRVPEDVAVIGVDNDTLMCQMCTPPMTSIALDAETGGYEAARILDGLMSGTITKKQQYLVAPLHVVSRQSTERFDIPDPVVAEALRLIWINPGLPINVGELANEICVSRRRLEVQFKAIRGRTVLDEISLARLHHVKQLIKETDMRVKEIAESCGFATEGYLSRFFHKQTGMTISQFRQEARGSRQ